MAALDREMAAYEFGDEDMPGSQCFDPALVGLAVVKREPLRMLSDNVLIALEPPPKETASGIALVQSRKAGAREHRTARVLAVGPGHYSGCKACGGERKHFIPTELKAGDRVVVDAMCGQNYALDLSAPRHHSQPNELGSFGGERGEYRIIREGEVLAVLDSTETLVA